jgi:thiol-disulfide isomerase/thioredoxin
MKSYKKSIAVLVVLCGVMISLNTSAQKKKAAIRPIAKATPQKKEEAKPIDFKVNVKWPDGDGKFVLLTTNRNGLPITLDSVSVVNGAATLQMPAPDLYATVYLGVNGNYFKEVLVYPGKLHVEITNDPTSGLNSKLVVKGGLEQNLYQEFTDVFSTGLMTNMARSKVLKTIGTKKNTDSIMNSYRPKFDSLLHVQDYVSKKYADQDIAGYILTKRISSLSAEEREKQFNDLSPRVKAGPYGKMAQNIVKGIEQRKVGNAAYPYALLTKDNKEIKLADFKGKYVLLDFWSSTCGPCLRMAPYMKKLYDTYRDKGFEIIAVSLDTKKADWIRAMEQHAISGIQVSSLKGGKDPLAEFYSIFQMPAMILIDKNGNNAGQVDPQALDAKLAELFDKG